MKRKHSFMYGNLISFTKLEKRKKYNCLNGVIIHRGMADFAFGHNASCIERGVTLRCENVASRCILMATRSRARPDRYPGLQA
jgi:hypothetical protein